MVEPPQAYPQPPNQPDGMEAAPGAIAERLITLLQEMYDAQQTLVLSLSAAEQQAPGTLEQWSAKDMLAHISAWIDVLNLRLDLSARGETPPAYTDVNQINETFYRDRHKLSWSAVLEASRKAYNGLLERIHAMQDAELTAPAPYAWLNGDPLWRGIMRTAYIHPLIHLAYYYNARGQKALGLQIQEDAARKLLAIDPSPAWRSITFYNLACQYALSGDKLAAVNLLRQALAADTGVLEWSKQDPDFEAIRDDPDFKAVYDQFDRDGGEDRRN